MTGDQGSQYLTFLLDGEYYGVSILKVQEIRTWDTATRVPNTPAHLCGVVNLRGNIVPVYDLRRRFGLPVLEYTRETVVIILSLEESGDQQQMIGLVVDAVSDVLDAKANERKPPPNAGLTGTSGILAGMVSLEQGLVLLPDVERIVQGSAIQVSPAGGSGFGNDGLSG